VLVKEERDTSVELRRALVEAMSDPFRAQVYGVVVDRPGATIAQISERIGQSSRRVRHQMDRLLRAGLVAVDTETPRRNARERHYRALVSPRVVDQPGDSWTDDQRRRMAASVTRLLVEDIARASQHRTFGIHEGHAEVRFSGAVDETGWAELAEVMVRTTSEIEAIMTRSAGRLQDTGLGGIEVILGLLLFETLPWGLGEGESSGPRPSRWLESGPPDDPDDS
jgi:DNA-binding transcriptional ArsR family regulator